MASKTETVSGLDLGRRWYMDRPLREWKASMTSVASRPSYQSIQWGPAGWALRHPKI